MRSSNLEKHDIRTKQIRLPLSTWQWSLYVDLGLLTNVYV